MIGELWQLIFKVLVSYALTGLILWLVRPHIGLGYGLLVAMLAWMLMGAYWFR